MPVGLFGITNDTLNLVVSLLILFLIVLWLALVAWTFFDARRRIQDTFLVICATAASLIFPFLGAIVYSILRPPEFLADQHERQLEIRAAELRLRQLEEQSCPNCEHPVERNFLRCPNCRARIKDPCESCGKPIDPRWSVCPYCETPVRRAAPPERRPEPKRRGRPRPSTEREPERAAQRKPEPAARKAATAERKPEPAERKPEPAERKAEPAERKAASGERKTRKAAPSRSSNSAPRTAEQPTEGAKPRSGGSRSS
jgi:hypothetical protein